MCVCVCLCVGVCVCGGGVGRAKYFSGAEIPTKKIVQSIIVITMGNKIVTVHKSVL